MAEADVTEGLRLSAENGWNQREEDWRLLLRLSGGAFRVAVDDGRVVATGGAVLYGRRLAWICMMLVEPARRGQGLGTRIVRELLGELRGVASVGLDATPAGRPVYSTVGFQDGPELVRMGARGDRPRPDAGAARAVSASRLPAILEMDREAFGADRAAVLRYALETAPEYAWSVEDDAGLQGYCFGRHGQHSEHVGPVVARTEEAARQLVGACLGAGSGRFILDAPADRPGWRAALEALGFEEQRRLTRMYLGAASGPGRRDLQLAICGPELG